MGLPSVQTFKNVIARYIESGEGRRTMASKMTPSLRRFRDYSAVGRKAFLVEDLEDGALPIYDKDPIVPAYAVGEAGDSIQVLITSERVFAPLYELATWPLIPLTQIRERRYDLIKRTIELGVAGVKEKEDVRVFATINALASDSDNPHQDIAVSAPLTADAIADGIGARLGLSVWAPMNDRGRTWQGKKVGDIERLVRELPPQFDPVAMKTVSYIDVIWLEKQAIVAAFEIEHTSAVYSGLLRMADLMTLVPNQEIRWYIVAPEERFAKFAFQIGRPTFAHLRKPLHTVCKFLPYGVLVQQLENAEQFLAHMRPEFIGDLAIAYDPKDAIDEPKK